jgi:ribosome-binding factor A
MPQTHRLEKVNQLIRQELSQMLQREIKDPRLSGYISVNSVMTTPDLRHARVLVSCVCEDAKKKEMLEALSHSAGFFRSNLAKKLNMRTTPELHFLWDDSIEKGSRLIELIDKVTAPAPKPDQDIK